MFHRSTQRAQMIALDQKSRIAIAPIRHATGLTAMHLACAAIIVTVCHRANTFRQTLPNFA